MQKHQIQRIAVDGYIVNEKNEVLLLKRKDDDDFLPGHWGLPGGASEFGEEPIEATMREVKEETGLDVNVLYPLRVSTYFSDAKKTKHTVKIVYFCKLKKSKQKPTIGTEHSAYQWINIHQTKTISPVSDWQRNNLIVLTEHPFIKNMD